MLWNKKEDLPDDKRPSNSAREGPSGSNNALGVVGLVEYRLVDRRINFGKATKCRYNRLRNFFETKFRVFLERVGNT